MAPYQKKSFEEKKKEVRALTKSMERNIENHFHSPEDLKEYLSFMGKFYKYSLSNVALIQSNFQGAQAVGSFKFWKDNGFSVNKGEKGIPILVPNRTVPKFKDEEGKWKPINNAKNEEKKKIEDGKIEVTKGSLYFSIGHVFDISQTNASAKDLPKIFPNRWLEGNVQDYKDLYKGMEAIAEKNGIKIIKPKEELGAAKGVSYTLTKEVALNPRNSELQNVKTLLHELTHAKLHTKDTFLNYSSAEKEFQAEMAAYTVSSYFGIDTSEYSLEYLHNWTKGKDFKDKTQLLKEVHETSVSFIETMEETLMKEKEKNNSLEKGKEKAFQEETAAPSKKKVLEQELSNSYERYKRLVQSESPHDVDSILERAIAEEKYFTAKTVAIDNGLLSQEQVVKLEHQVETKLSKDNNGQVNGQVYEISLTLQERFDLNSRMQTSEKQSNPKRKKQEMELER